MVLDLNPEIWGKYYWFTLHSIARTYPDKPNKIVKKKYYDFIQNLPLFLPNQKISIEFEEYLEKYPVTPYLESKESFIKWMHFIHNRINQKLEKPLLSFTEALIKYNNNYSEKERLLLERKKNKEKIIYSSVILSLFALIVFLYK